MTNFKPFDFCRAMNTYQKLQTLEGQPARIVDTNFNGEMLVVLTIAEQDSALTYSKEGVCTSHAGMGRLVMLSCQGKYEGALE